MGALYISARAGGGYGVQKRLRSSTRAGTGGAGERSEGHVERDHVPYRSAGSRPGGVMSLCWFLKVTPTLQARRKDHGGQHSCTMGSANPN